MDRKVTEGAWGYAVLRQTKASRYH